MDLAGDKAVKSLETIRKRIRDGESIVMTAGELKSRLSRGESISIRDVDVVTCGTCGIMSGTYAVLSFPVASPGSFLRAGDITINGVPCIPGPCPNERLGIVDLMVFGTAHGSSSYGGGHLIRDIVSGKEVEVEVTAEGRRFPARVDITGMPHARLFTTRSAFRNYVAMVNPGEVPERTIFSVKPLAGKCSEATVSGCGEISPLENDPLLRFLTPGTPVLVNGGRGFVIGTGTRATSERPNISVHADLASMDPQFCGGFVTSAGPECISSIATAVPVLDEAVLESLKVRDHEIPLPVMDIGKRREIGRSSYERVWQGTARKVTFDASACLHCDPCLVRDLCPVSAIRRDGTIDQERCFVCGTCVHTCAGQAYQAVFGSVLLGTREVPIVLRQSDRARAERLCGLLRDRIMDGSFSL
jgi:putative methanogenesis marker 16 metalloprotein